MIKSKLTLILCGTISSLLYSGEISPNSICGNSFAVKESKSLFVTDGNEIFIPNDQMNQSQSFDIAETIRKDRIENASIINVIHKEDKKLQFRKEVALYDDGHLELTVKMRFFPFTDQLNSKPGTYSFQVPVELLDGMNFRAVCGKNSHIKKIDGIFGPDNGNISKCRYIVFEKNGKSFTFDFNPPGPYSEQDYWEIIPHWDITRNGKYVNFSFGTYVRYCGHLITGKVLIYKGIHDFEQAHAQRSWAYAAGNESGFIKQFSFGTSSGIKKFEKADCSRYSPEKKWGWETTAGLELLQSQDTALIDSCVFSRNGTPNEFLTDVPPGYYIISVRCGHNTQKTGPLSISVNGKALAENIEIPAGKTKSIDIPYFLKDPAKQIRIGFSGKNTWAVRSVIIQAVVFQNEDFSISRKLWVADKLFSPEIEYMD